MPAPRRCSRPARPGPVQSNQQKRPRTESKLDDSRRRDVFWHPRIPPGAAGGEHPPRIEAARDQRHVARPPGLAGGDGRAHGARRGTHARAVRPPARRLLRPPPLVCEAMMRSDVNILLASTGMLHARANAAAMAAGIPAICMDGGMTLEMFQSGAVTEDVTEMARIKHYVAKNVFGTEAKECRVTSAYGTDFAYSVEERIFVPPLPGDSFDPYGIIDFARDEGRDGALYYYLFPTGEFNVAPIEGSGNGRLVIELTMHHFGR